MHATAQACVPSVIDASADLWSDMCLHRHAKQRAHPMPCERCQCFRRSEHVRCEKRIVDRFDHVPGACWSQVRDLVGKTTDHVNNALKRRPVPTDEGSKDATLRTSWTAGHCAVEVAHTMLDFKFLSDGRAAS